MKNLIILVTMLQLMSFIVEASEAKNKRIVTGMKSVTSYNAVVGGK